jgi:L-ascorbate metabolism protein UlaG (beta-lactamase superfamily)
MKHLGLAGLALLACNLAGAAATNGPAHVDITWLSIANMYFQVGERHILVDGYITRLPQSAFSGGGGGLARTSQAFTPDVAAVTRVMNALGGPRSVDLLLTGHSHFDHSFDTATWSRLTGAPIIGSPTTCLQARAAGIPASRCTPVYGGERIAIASGVSLRVIRWNHSGSSSANPEQHDPVELEAPPVPDPRNGGLHGGVAEDFPNGGGGRALLFVVNGPHGRYSWLYQDSASAEDLEVPIVIDGKDYGAPLENLKAALRSEGLESVDLWIATGGAPVARLVLPVLKPRAYLPLQALLAAAGVQLIRPRQYLDKWRLDATGMHAMANEAARQALGIRNPN